MGRSRQKRCDRCSNDAPTLYRVQWDSSGQWHFVCDRCWPAIQANNPDYNYGGTWTAKKRC